MDEVPAVFREAIEERLSGRIDLINVMSREDFVKAQIAWKIGSPDWYDIFTYWLDQAGLQIIEKPETQVSK